MLQRYLSVKLTELYINLHKTWRQRVLGLERNDDWGVDSTGASLFSVGRSEHYCGRIVMAELATTLTVLTVRYDSVGSIIVLTGASFTLIAAIQRPK